MKRLRKFLKQQEKRVLKTLKNSHKAATDWNVNNLSQHDWDDENIRLLDEVLIPGWDDGAQAGVALANSTYRFGISYDIVQPLFIDTIQEFGLTSATSINNTTKDKLLRVLTNGIEQGLSNQEIAENIQAQYDTISEGHALSIARTETHMSTVMGGHITYSAAGVSQKEWFTSLDGRERDWHADMNGQIQSIDEPFISGLGNELQFPGDPSASDAGELVNCRCVEIPIL